MAAKKEADDIEDEDEVEDSKGKDAKESDEEGAEEGEGEGKPSGRDKKKLLLIIGGATLVVLLGLGGAFFAGIFDPLLTMFSGRTKAEKVDAPQAVFYDLPELLVNLNTGTQRRAAFLKIRVSLELQRAEDVPKVEAVMPRIIDNFQVYLRELRVEDLKGSAGMYRLREELLTRVAAAAAPARVNDVLFKEMLVQ